MNLISYGRLSSTFKFGYEESFSLICMLSLTLFWLDATHYQICLLTLSKLLIMYLVFIPLVLFVSPRGFEYLRKLSDTRYKTIKILLYVLFVTSFYCYTHLNYTSSNNEVDSVKSINIIVMNIVFILNIGFVSFVTLLGCKVLFYPDNKILSSPNWRMVLALIICKFMLWFERYTFPAFNDLFFKIYLGLFPFYAKQCGYGTQVCLQTLIGNNTKYFILSNWLYFLPIVFMLPGIIDRKNIGFVDLKNKKESGFWGWAIVAFALETAYIIKAYLIDKTTFPPLIQMIMVFYYCFLGPIYEEIIYRGIIQNYFCRIGERIPLIRKYPNVMGIFAASIIFALAHHNSTVGLFLQRTLFGVLFGTLFFKSGTIWFPTIVHVTHNIIVSSLFVLK